MNVRVGSVIRFIALVVAGLCLLLTVYLGIDAIQGSQLTGAGAAQADFGFYLVLRAVSPVLLLGLLIAFAAGLLARRQDSAVVALADPVALTVYAGLIGLAWNWVFLFFFWR
jgi:hypothetical protein